MRRLFFSFAVGNTDMHLKNVSLVYLDPRRPTLAPAYDILCTVPYLTDRIDIGLKLAGSRRFERVSAGSYQRLAERVGAPVEDTLQVVADIADRLEPAWESVRPMMSAPPEHTAYLDRRIPDVCRRFR